MIKKTLSFFLWSTMALSLVIMILPEGVFGQTQLQSQDTFNQEVRILEPELQIGIPTVEFTPGEKLKQQLEGQQKGERLLHVPFLAEYVAAVYKYAVAIAGVLAIVMLILAGFQWVLSGGNPEGVNTAKKRIGNALIGLLLAVGSYTLLYTINPGLVKFRSLTILFIEPVEFEVVARSARGLDQEVTAQITGKWTAKNITTENDRAGKKMIRLVRQLGITDGFSTPEHPENCPLDFSSKAQVDNPGALDAIFKRYAECLPVKWQTLRAMAQIESSLNPQAENPDSHFLGLFQTKPKYCKGALEPYGLKDYCNNESLRNPEVSTMVATAMMRTSLQAIEGKCGKTIPVDSLYYFIYTGHHGGIGTLKKVLQETCDYTQACSHIYNTWQENYSRRYADSPPASPCGGP